MEVPARHGEGKFLAADGVLERLENGHQVVARYAGPDGRPTEDWPFNPNGSPRGVAGVCDPAGRLFGLMPHPDAFLYPYHHPLWARRRLDGPLPDEGDGMRIFRNGVDAAAAALGAPSAD
jgi:phosphoribosylformylglycinamidine synthase